jgi:hypothetical protein
MRVRTDVGTSVPVHMIPDGHSFYCDYTVYTKVSQESINAAFPKDGLSHPICGGIQMHGFHLRIFDFAQEALYLGVGDFLLGEGTCRKSD